MATDFWRRYAPLAEIDTMLFEPSVICQPETGEVAFTSLSCASSCNIKDLSGDPMYNGYSLIYMPHADSYILLRVETLVRFATTAIDYVQMLAVNDDAQDKEHPYTGKLLPPDVRKKNSQKRAWINAAMQEICRQASVEKKAQMESACRRINEASKLTP